MSSGARLIMVASEFPRLSETFLVNKFRGLLGIGYDVFVVCRHSREEEWARFPQLAGDREARARVRPRGRAGLGALARALRCSPRGCARYLTRAVALDPRRLAGAAADARFVELAPDLVHFEFGGAAIARTHLKSLLGSRLVVSFRGQDIAIEGLEDPRHYDALWRDVDAVHTNGRDLWARALARGCPPAMPHRLISPAVDVERFAAIPRAAAVPAGTAGRPLRLLSIGRLHWKKGHEYTVAALRLLRERGVHAQLRIVGEGEHRAAVLAACRSFALEPYVELLGARAPDQIPEQLAWADLLVHASVQEGFANVLIEAQAAGLPVVTSDSEGALENVAHGETGFVVPRRDPRALAERLEQLAADADARGRLGDAGRLRAARCFRLEDQIAAFDDFYREVLARPPRS